MKPEGFCFEVSLPVGEVLKHVRNMFWSENDIPKTEEGWDFAQEQCGMEGRFPFRMAFEEENGEKGGGENEKPDD